MTGLTRVGGPYQRPPGTSRGQETEGQRPPATLLVRCAAGETVPLCRDYRVGVRSRWFWGDVDHFYLRLRNGNDSRWSVVRDFLSAFIRRDRNEVWRWKVPLPFAVETLQWLGALTPGTSDATSRSRVVPTESVPDSAVP